MEQIPFGTNDFAENPEPRVPCILVLDVSGSMAGNPITQLNEGIRVFKDELTADSLASKRVEVAIITFGEDVVLVNDFSTAEGLNPPQLTPAGMTPMGKAVDTAMAILEQRKRTYRENSIAYYRPWIFLITDGAPNDPGWEHAAQRSMEGDKNKAFALFAVGVDNAQYENLRQFTPREPLALKGMRFRELFLWLSSSLKSVSRSNPSDDVVPLVNPVTPTGWAAIV
ncbi:VWA domain-containing protein [Anatilimnocola sp. NA78]|uniref:vWA domain-containing protein n=1 Tax=Anatilimnocola sp. NA78 TaxID=3415683 RepID=UPI003CE4FD56